MAGLFEKDIRIMLKNRQSLAIFIFLAVFFSFFQQSIFTIAYMVCLCTLFTVSTISYDESDNGYTFLMTLPVTMKDYVLEKYLFCMSGGLASWCFSIAVFLISSIIKGVAVDFGQELLPAAMLLPVMVLLAAVFIPVQLKFGAEKGRIALLVIMGIFFGICYAGGMLLEKSGVNPESILSRFENLPLQVYVIALVAAAGAALAVSVACSLHIMRNKEY